MFLQDFAGRHGKLANYLGGVYTGALENYAVGVVFPGVLALQSLVVSPIFR